MSLNNETSYGICNASSILKKALQNKYAIAHINANNLEWIKAIVETAVETNSPIIIGFSVNAIKYMGGYDNVVAMVKNITKTLNSEKKVPIVIHLDHGDYDAVKQAIAAGFTSVMFDGSKLPFNQNYEKTKELLALATQNNISFEAEIGAIGKDKSLGEFADVQQCKEITSLGLDCLAVGIGNIHGLYPSDWKSLNFELLSQIHQEIPHTALVLHGGTGIDNQQIKKAIGLGIAKINVNTECQIAFQKALRNYFEQQKDLDYVNHGYDPRKILFVGMQAIKETIIEKLKLFGSYGVI